MIAESLNVNTTLQLLSLSRNNIKEPCGHLLSNIHSAGAQSFDELQRYNNTLKKVILINNNIGDLGDHGDQELNSILIASLPSLAN